MNARSRSDTNNTKRVVDRGSDARNVRTVSVVVSRIVDGRIASVTMFDNIDVVIADAGVEDVDIHVDRSASVAGVGPGVLASDSRDTPRNRLTGSCVGR